MFDFVEAVHVELPDKTINFIMSKVTREDNFFKFDNIFNNKLCSVLCPKDNFLKLLILFLVKFYV